MREREASRVDMRASVRDGRIDRCVIDVVHRVSGPTLGAGLAADTPAIALELKRERRTADA